MQQAIKDSGSQGAVVVEDFEELKGTQGGTQGDGNSRGRPCNYAFFLVLEYDIN